MPLKARCVYVPSMTTRTTAPRYLFERELGHGGFGSVVLATDFVLGRRVALKSLRGSDSGALAAEARVLAALRHPNIVQVYDLTTIEGEPYLVLEFIDGQSVRELLEKGSIPPKEAVRHARAVAAALTYAHAAGVVHNDVKPENILVVKGGAALLTDFGVASSPQAATLLPGEAESIVGSLPYIAPEVIQGAAPGAQSDLYALAATLYEMLSGAPPFAGPGAAGMAQRLAGPPPRVVIAEPRWSGLADVLERALAPLPIDRYPDIQAFMAALNSVSNRTLQAALFAAPAPSPAKTLQSPRRRRMAVGAAIAVFGLVLVGAAAVFVGQRPGGADATSLRGLVDGTPTGTVNTGSDGTATDPATTPALEQPTAAPAATVPDAPSNPRDIFPGFAKGNGKSEGKGKKD